MIFKKGDKVRALVSNRDVVIGKIYTVQAPDRYKGTTNSDIFSLEESGYWQPKHIFKLISPKNKPGVFE